LSTKKEGRERIKREKEKNGKKERRGRKEKKN
jgi:hypothetical protein